MTPLPWEADWSERDALDAPAPYALAAPLPPPGPERERIVARVFELVADLHRVEHGGGDGRELRTQLGELVCGWAAEDLAIVRLALTGLRALEG